MRCVSIHFVLPPSLTTFSVSRTSWAYIGKLPALLGGDLLPEHTGQNMGPGLPVFFLAMPIPDKTLVRIEFCVQVMNQRRAMIWQRECTAAYEWCGSVLVVFSRRNGVARRRRTLWRNLWMLRVCSIYKLQKVVPIGKLAET